MGKYQSEIRKAAENKLTLSNFAPQPGLGRHIVALEFFRGGKTQKTKETIFESQFTIMESDTETVGASRGWPWFIARSGFAGQYQFARNQQFVTAIMESIGDDREVEDVQDELLDGDEREVYGVLLELTVTEAIKDGVVLRNKAGNVIGNDAWAAIPQTQDDIASTQEKMKAMRAALGKSKATEPVAAPPKKEALPVAAETPAPPPAAKVGGIKSLLGKKSA